MQDFVDNELYEKNAAAEEGTMPAAADSHNAGGEDNTAARPRELFALWPVRGKTYKLKLTPSGITGLERVYKRNLISLMGDLDNMPTLTTMLQVTHAAAEKWQHNLKLKDVHSLYDQWVEDGGSMLQFYVEVYMKIFSVSGFFSNAMAEELTDTMDEAAAQM